MLVQGISEKPTFQSCPYCQGGCIISSGADGLISVSAWDCNHFQVDFIMESGIIAARVMFRENGYHYKADIKRDFNMGYMYVK